jgi:hypothetical protein
LKQNIEKNNNSLSRKLQQITDTVKNAQKQKSGENRRSSEITSTVQKETPPREKTLIIGDSVIKGIQQKGLNDKIDIKKCSGAKIKDISNSLDNLDMGPYSNVIIHVGGNDVSGGKRHETSYQELLEITVKLQEQQRRVFLCTVCPRQDVDISQLNRNIRRICQETGAYLIEAYQAFVYGNGDTVEQYFSSDGIHLNMHGSRTLVATINKCIQIIKHKRHVENAHVSQSSAGRERRIQQNGIFCCYCGITGDHISDDCSVQTRNAAMHYGGRQTWNDRRPGSENYYYGQNSFRIYRN